MFESDNRLGCMHDDPMAVTPIDETYDMVWVCQNMQMSRRASIRVDWGLCVQMSHVSAAAIHGLRDYCCGWRSLQVDSLKVMLPALVEL